MPQRLPALAAQPPLAMRAPAGPSSADRGCPPLPPLRRTTSGSGSASPPPAATPSPAASGSLYPWAQCGGSTGACGSTCADLAWPTASCSSGYSCVRQDQFYWQCRCAACAAGARRLVLRPVSGRELVLRAAAPCLPACLPAVTLAAPLPPKMQAHRLRAVAAPHRRHPQAPSSL
jgi:hypothetical protein